MCFEDEEFAWSARIQLFHVNTHMHLPIQRDSPKLELLISRLIKVKCGSIVDNSNSTYKSLDRWIGLGMVSFDQRLLITKIVISSSCTSGVEAQNVIRGQSEGFLSLYMVTQVLSRMLIIEPRTMSTF